MSPLYTNLNDFITHCNWWTESECRKFVFKSHSLQGVHTKGDR